MLRIRFIIPFLIVFSVYTIGLSPKANADIPLPKPGDRLSLSQPTIPLQLKGLQLNKLKPLQLDFLVDTGQDNAQDLEEIHRLINYFMTGLTLPEGDLWVNLSPYEHNRIAPESLSSTELGRDLLKEDYILKQMTASLIYPEGTLGKEFWKKVYLAAQKKWGTTNIPLDTFNKVWIVPNKAEIVEKGSNVYITHATLKVLLDKDYYATQRNAHHWIAKETVAAESLRELVIPILEKEVNEGEQFSLLRQIYTAMILSKWYKERVENPILNTLFIDKGKIRGLNKVNLHIREEIYAQYVEAYKKGVFNFVKEETQEDGTKAIRKYFSGGLKPMPSHLEVGHKPIKVEGSLKKVTVHLDKAMTSPVQSQSVLFSPDGQRQVKIGIAVIDPEVVTPHILIAKDVEEKLHAINRDNNSIKYLDRETGETITDWETIRHILPPTEKLIDDFLKDNPHLIRVADSSNENLFYNAPLIAVEGTRVYQAAGIKRQSRDRAYPMLVIRDDPQTGKSRVDIEKNVRFKFIDKQHKHAQILIHGREQAIKYATTLQLIKDEHGFVDPGRQWYFYDDVRHIFALPKLSEEDLKLGYHVVSGGIYLFTKELLANNGVRIRQYFKNPQLWQVFDLPIPEEYLVKSLEEAGYSPDEYQIDKEKKRIRIHLHENLYPFHIIGITADGKIKEIAINGSSGKEGLTIREAYQLAEKQGLVRAGILDQGKTVRVRVGSKMYGTGTVDQSNLYGARSTSVILYTQQKEMTNPLSALNDPNVRRVFTNIVRNRYDPRVLTELYHLGAVPLSFTHKGELLTKDQFVEKMISFLVQHQKEHPLQVAQKFQEAFPNMARPKELNKKFNQYRDIKKEAFDLVLIQDLLHMLKPHSRVADFGAGTAELGQAILNYGDAHKLNISQVIATDVNDWHTTSDRERRLRFYIQPNGVTVPVPSNSLDLVIEKWVKHHMSFEEQLAFLRTNYRTMKPGALFALIEPLGTEGMEKELLKYFQDELKDPAIWPKVSSRADYEQVTYDFMNLTGAQQMQVNALEDYFGHNCVMGRDWMPQTFTYRPVKEWLRVLKDIGFVEVPNLRKVLGASPISRTGPPSVRLVFRKPYTSTILLGDSGVSKSFMLFDEISQAEEHPLRNVLSTLVNGDVKAEELKIHPANEILLFSNARLDTIAEAAVLLNYGLTYHPNFKQRVVILQSEISEPNEQIEFIKSAINEGYTLELGEGKQIKRNTFTKAFNPAKDISYSTPQLIRQVMFQMVQKNPKIFPKLAQVLAKENLNTFIRIPVSGYIGMLGHEGVLNSVSQDPYRVVFLGAPHQQLYNWGLLQSVFYRYPDKIVLLGHPVSYENVPAHRDKILTDILREVWRLIINSEEYGNHNIRLKGLKYPEGLNSFSNEFWEDAVQLLNALGPSKDLRRGDFAEELMRLYTRTADNAKPLEKLVLDAPADKDGLVTFVQEVLHSGRGMDQAMRTPGGIDLNQIHLEHAHSIALNGDPQEYQYLKEDFVGLSPRILRVENDVALEQTFN